MHFLPPPPSQGRRTRSSSRTRSERGQALFSLSALASRSRTLQSPPHAESSQQAGARNMVQHSYQHPVSGDSRSFDVSAYPPAARRAASTGAVDVVSLQSGSGYSPPASTRNATLPIPPPPPGLPRALHDLKVSIDQSESNLRLDSSQALSKPHLQPDVLLHLQILRARVLTGAANASRLGER